MEAKYYIEGKLNFEPNPESKVGLYIGDVLVSIIEHFPLIGKFKVEFRDGEKTTTDMVTPIDLTVEGHKVDKKNDIEYIMSHKLIGDTVLFRLRACKNGERTLTVKKGKPRNSRSFFIDKFGDWFVPPGYNYVLGYVY